MDSMLIQLAIIVLVASIVVFFSREFADYIKKVLTIPGLAWILPVIIASCAVVYFEDWVFWFVLTLRGTLQSYYLMLASLMPFAGGGLIAGILILMLWSVLPVLLINMYMKRAFYKEFESRYIASIVLWIFCTAVLVV